MFTFNYTLEKIEKLSDYVEKAKNPYELRDGLVSKLDINIMLNLLKKCNAKQIEELRGIFINFYRAINIREFYLKDKENLESFKQGIAEMLQNYDNILDKIQRLQLEFFVSN